MLLNILLVILVLDCIALVAVILLQQSEGGALGMGGGPTGMFTARGAGDLLTRTTQILAGVFFVLALLITLLSGWAQRNNSVVDRLKLGDALSPMAPASPSVAGQTTAPAASSTAPPLPGAASTAPPLPSAAQQAAPPLPGAAPAPSVAVPSPATTSRRAATPAPAASTPPPARAASRPARATAAPATAAPAPSAPAATPSASQ